MVECVRALHDVPKAFTHTLEQGTEQGILQDFEYRLQLENIDVNTAGP